MAEVIEAKIRTLKAPVAWFVAENPILLEGELSTEEETLRQKVGDGVSAYADLPYVLGSREPQKTIAVTAPDTDVRVSFFLPIGGTVSQVTSVVDGLGGPSCSFSLSYGFDAGASGLPLVVGGLICNSTSTGDVVTVFDNGDVPAGSWMTLTVSAVTGTVYLLSVSVEF